jgi:type I restriction enzyme S subunit
MDIALPGKDGLVDGPFGSNLPSSAYTQFGVPVIRGSNLTKGSERFKSDEFVYVSSDTAARLSRSLCLPKDIVFTKKGTLGQIGLVPSGKHSTYLLSSNQMRLRVDESCADPEFVYYYLAQSESIEKIIRDSEHTGVPKINLGYLKSFPIFLPEVRAQKEIASALSAFDDRITLLRETNATLEAIAQALFKSWFVDFDPVRAKMAGRAPEGMDEATAALFPDALEETALGLVPKDWTLVPFGHLLSHTIGGDWGSDEPDEKNDTRVAIIRGTDIPDLQSGAASRVPIRYTSTKKLTTRAIQDGDIVLEVSGGSKDQPTGRSLYITNALLKNFECSVEPASFCRLFRPASKALGVLLSQHLTFIYGEGKTWEYQNQSTGIANFQTTHFLEKELVAVPDEKVIEAFASLVRPIVDRVHAAQIRGLAELRDTLLPRLISGQLSLPEAHAQLKAAA